MPGDARAPPRAGDESAAGHVHADAGRDPGGVSGGGSGGPTPVSPGAIASNSIATGSIQVVNLMRVPTSQQVLLKVRVAELNRTAFRQIGADFLASIPGASSLFGSSIAGNGFTGALGNTTFPYRLGTTLNAGSANGLALGTQGTFFGTFSHGNFVMVLDALRRNNILKILAEPNLIALNGYQANFLAGGQFPVPILQGGNSGSGNGGISSPVQGLRRPPGVPPADPGRRHVIRLTVDPEVSTIDFTVGTTLVPGGSPIPGLNTRTSHTTVELRQGETLAIAGLLQLSLSGQTQRLPGLGDLPYIGAFFSNTTSERIEKELVVTVTPYLVEPMMPDQVPAGPGDEVREPNDLEFFFMNRIEGRTSIDKRSTTTYDDPFHLIRHSIVEKKYLIGPVGLFQLNPAIVAMIARSSIGPAAGGVQGDRPASAPILPWDVVRRHRRSGDVSDPSPALVGRPHPRTRPRVGLDGAGLLAGLAAGRPGRPCRPEARRIAAIPAGPAEALGHPGRTGREPPGPGDRSRSTRSRSRRSTRRSTSRTRPGRGAGGGSRGGSGAIPRSSSPGPWAPRSTRHGRIMTANAAEARPGPPPLRLQVDGSSELSPRGRATSSPSSPPSSPPARSRCLIVERTPDDPALAEAPAILAVLARLARGPCPGPVGARPRRRAPRAQRDVRASDAQIIAGNALGRTQQYGPPIPINSNGVNSPSGVTSSSSSSNINP